MELLSVIWSRGISFGKPQHNIWERVFFGGGACVECTAPYMRHFYGLKFTLTLLHYESEHYSSWEAFFQANKFYIHVESAHSFSSSSYFSLHGSFQVMALVPVGFASVIQTGRGRTATVLLVQTPACPVWGCCAAVVVSVCVGAVNALSPGPTAPPATNAPPALTPAP